MANCGGFDAGQARLCSPVGASSGLHQDLSPVVLPRTTLINWKSDGAISRSPGG